MESRCDLEARRLVWLCAETNDGETWEEFLDRYGERIRAGVMNALRRCRRAGVDGRVEDLVQEVYCRLLENDRRLLKLCRGENDREVGTFFARVAQTTTLDRLRYESAQKRDRRRLVRLTVLEEQRGFDGLVDPSLSVRERMHSDELRDRFRECCRQHCRGPQRRRNLRILEAAYLQGWTSREIAGRLGVGLQVASIDSILHRLRRRLAVQGLELPQRRGRLLARPDRAALGRLELA